MWFHMPNTRISFGEETCCGICEGLRFVLPLVQLCLSAGGGFGFVSLLLAAGSLFLSYLFISSKRFFSPFLCFPLSVSVYLHFLLFLSLSVFLPHTSPSPTPTPITDPTLASLIYFPQLSLTFQSSG